MTNASENWYVVKREDGHCDIVPGSELAETDAPTGEASAPEQWGPFDSAEEATARRVGLIRAGKCQPV